MKRLFISLAILLMAAPLAMAQLPANFLQSLLDPQATPAANSQEESLYASGTDALNNGNYTTAIEVFGNVAKMKGRRADAALYWKAYARSKQGQRGEALATL